ncbi:cytochrome c-type biogenesis protein [Bartonella ancashensis]|uniref:Cytochrome c-type biogenesis protein n=1 Tax=Bartonella ancashensis TaxID=1318743 RepID=A0A0M4LHC6_9HYPH|nr:cytochrome c-type biogenesis protein [Bartonella ancashensis]ALE04032.1 Cytochrome c heme lyase subunit CcmL [Bartonella ancashensis]
MKKFFFLFFMSCAIIFSVHPGETVEPDEILEDSMLEARARDLSSYLRCPVCQSQSIDDSDSPLARDLRLLVRERLKEGDSDQQIIDFLVERYGELILLKPPFNSITWFLWLSPLMMIIIGISYISFRVKNCRYERETNKSVRS